MPTTIEPSSPALITIWRAGQLSVFLEKDGYDYGFDAQTGEFANLLSRGVIDPTKVVRTALQGAASIGGLLISTEAMVAEEPRESTHPEGHPHPPHGGDIDF